MREILLALGAEESGGSLDHLDTNLVYFSKLHSPCFKEMVQVLTTKHSFKLKMKDTLKYFWIVKQMITNTLPLLFSGFY